MRVVVEVVLVVLTLVTILDGSRPLPSAASHQRYTFGSATPKRAARLKASSFTSPAFVWQILSAHMWAWVVLIKIHAHIVSRRDM